MSRHVTVIRPLDRRAAWFPKLRFGMFIHFGLYSLLQRHEWVMRNEGMSREDYRKLMRRFNPTRFDADQWVAAAKNAGARYIAITAKHHDGFCLFDSAMTDFKVTNTPFGRDLIGEMVAACHRSKMRILLYYSQPDWTHPNYVHRVHDGKDLQFARPREGDAPDWPAYLRYYFGQVEELCTKYGRIDGIWFDGVGKSEADWRGRDIYRLIKRHQPSAVVNDRAGYGDFHTPERRLSTVPSEAGYMVEACDCVARGTWCYRPNAELKSSAAVLQSLLRMAGAGGNYLLNVGPKPDGTLPDSWMRPMLDAGEWLRKYGVSVYGTQGCPRQEESSERLYTRNGKQLYLHLLQWPETNRLVLKNLRTTPLRARLLGANGTLKCVSQKGEVAIEGLPAVAPDPLANVVEMTFAGSSSLKPAPPFAVPSALKVDGRSPLEIRLSDAPGVFLSFKGLPLPTYPMGGQIPEDFSNLWQPEHKVTWKLEVARAGRVEVSMEVACADNRHGSTFRIVAAGQSIEGRIPRTPSWWSDHKTFRVGELSLPKGTVKLTMHPLTIVHPGAFGIIRRITLTSMSSK